MILNPNGWKSCGAKTADTGVNKDYAEYGISISATAIFTADAQSGKKVKRNE